MNYIIITLIAFLISIVKCISLFKENKILKGYNNELENLDTSPLTLTLMARGYEVNQRLFNGKQKKYILSEKDYEDFKTLFFPTGVDPMLKSKKGYEEYGYRGIKVIKRKNGKTN